MLWPQLAAPIQWLRRFSTGETLMTCPPFLLVYCFLIDRRHRCCRRLLLTTSSSYIFKRGRFKGVAYYCLPS
ncbi:hypothetical protein E2C01_011602 [Portunus trituberculatus]|uniref:Uncharacterized protein n=1 Tax=Portunus trituberculatus TaxID=210409 RepID=A0A5B7DBF7_PORTR|nr:hypothetical protein [Portunus trituberculatus]